MNELPAWDGTERLKPLAKRVSDAPLWIKSFHIWMLGLAAQWLGTNQVQANSVAPILISEEQGRHKSTFCRMLMPPQLVRYYSDNLKLTAQGNPERLLAEMGLLNMDEFDKYGEQKMPLLKNLMQMSSLNICKAYQKNFRSLPRIASFIGTSNRTDLLRDPTGSRRFICIEAEHDIDCTGIEHAQIYAQLKEELLAGARHWFSKEEEHALQHHNSAYYHVNPIEDIVRSTYEPAALDEPDCLSLSAAIIHKELKKRFPVVLRSCTPIQLAQTLTAAGISRQHTRLGNVYLVKRVKSCEE
jgi:predicted P-loop ATPase